MPGSIVTVLQAADTIDLTVLDTVKQELGITDSAQDAKLARWIHEVSAQIATYCKRAAFGRERLSEAFRLSTPVGPLRLSRFPVAQVDSVTEGDMLLDADEWEADLAAGLVYRMHWGRRGEWYDPSVTVAYQAGYELLGELPYDVEQAALLLLSYRYQSGGRDPLIAAESIPGKYSVSYVPATKGTSMPGDVVELLDPYADTIV